MQVKLRAEQYNLNRKNLEIAQKTLDVTPDSNKIACDMAKQYLSGAINLKKSSAEAKPKCYGAIDDIDAAVASDVEGAKEMVKLGCN